MKSRIKGRSITGVASFAVLNGRLNSLVLILAASGILLISLVQPQLLSGVKVSLTDMVSPLVSAITKPFFMLSETIGGVSGVASLRAENAKLKAENIRLKEWYQTALMLQAENHSLQELLNLKLDPAHKYVTARVISDAGSSFVKTVLISAGEKQGIKQNQAVLAGEGMVGRIIEVGKNHSRILLLNDINSRVPVRIEGTSQKAILAGSNADKLILKHLPQDANVVNQARVVTSGDGGIFPPGLPIGRVYKQQEKTLFVKTFSDMNKVMFVRIVDSSLDKNLVRVNSEYIVE